MKKITLADIRANVHPVKLSTSKINSSHEKIDLSVKPDTFESTQNMKGRYESEMSGIEFKTYKINFYPEDIKKMKKMSLDEQIDYMTYLKRNNKYTISNKKGIK